VQRVLTIRAIANEGVWQGVDALVFDAFRATLLEHADDVVHAWRTPFDKAAATLAAAHAKLGSVALEDTAAIVNQGGDSAAVWADAQSASAVITTITGGWVALGQLTDLARVDQRFRVLHLVDVDYQTWQDQQLERRKLTPWQAVLAELTLSLPTMAEYRRRIAAIEDGHRQAQQRAEAEARAYGSGRRVDTVA
jgi:hypothetical protein